MKQFFPTIDAIHQFSLNLSLHQSRLICQHCSKQDQFVSHGFVHKQRSGASNEKVGKRLLCSNRYQHTGCGRTFQLYVASEIPHHQYGIAQLFTFIISLFNHFSVFDAYQKAINKTHVEPRNAWRWVRKLMCRLSDYRTSLFSVSEPDLDPTPTDFTLRSHRLQVLLSTLTSLSLKDGDTFCSAFQLNNQSAFM